MNTTEFTDALYSLVCENMSDIVGENTEEDWKTFKVLTVSSSANDGVVCGVYSAVNASVSILVSAEACYACDIDGYDMGSESHFTRRVILDELDHIRYTVLKVENNEAMASKLHDQQVDMAKDGI